MTPIVKASKGRQAIAFFTLKEYENWREEQGAAASGWQTKYYKGLSQLYQKSIAELRGHSMYNPDESPHTTQSGRSVSRTCS